MGESKTKTRTQRTIYGTRTYSGDYKPKGGDVKRLGFGWFIYDNGEWRRMRRDEMKALRQVHGSLMGQK